MKIFVILFAAFLFTACVHKEPGVSREPSAVRVATPLDLSVLIGRYKVVGDCEMDGQDVTGLRILPDRSQPGILHLVFFDEEVWIHQIRAGTGQIRDFSAPFSDGMMEWSTSLDSQVLKSVESVYRKSDPTKKITRNFTIALSGPKMSMNYETNAPESAPAGGKVTASSKKEEDEEEDETPAKPGQATPKNAAGEEVDICRFLRR